MSILYMYVYTYVNENSKWKVSVVFESNIQYDPKNSTIMFITFNMLIIFFCEKGKVWYIEPLILQPLDIVTGTQCESCQCFLFYRIIIDPFILQPMDIVTGTQCESCQCFLFYCIIIDPLILQPLDIVTGTQCESCQCFGGLVKCIPKTCPDCASVSTWFIDF